MRMWIGGLWARAAVTIAICLLINFVLVLLGASPELVRATVYFTGGTGAGALLAWVRHA